MAAGVVAGEANSKASAERKLGELQSDLSKKQGEAKTAAEAVTEAEKTKKTKGDAKTAADAAVVKAAEKVTAAEKAVKDATEAKKKYAALSEQAKESLTQLQKHLSKSLQSVLVADLKRGTDPLPKIPSDLKKSLKIVLGSLSISEIESALKNENGVLDRAAQQVKKTCPDAQAAIIEKACKDICTSTGGTCTKTI